MKYLLSNAERFGFQSTSKTSSFKWKKRYEVNEFQIDLG